MLAALVRRLYSAISLMRIMTTGTMQMVISTETIAR